MVRGNGSPELILAVFQSSEISDKSLRMCTTHVLRSTFLQHYSTTAHHALLASFLVTRTILSVRKKSDRCFV